VVTNYVPETWIPLNRWCRAQGLAAPSLLAVAPTPSYALRTTNGLFFLRTGSQVAHWNGVEVRMAFAPQVRDGEPFIHGLDLKKTVEPLVWGTTMRLQTTNLTIVIDPGHGGEDSGATSVLGHSYEKDFTLDWARRLSALLATNGWRVFLTRTTDRDLSISNRIAFAEAQKASLFLSLHFNSSAPNDQQSGLETYCLTPTGMASTVTRGFGDDLAQAFRNNAFDTQNLQFALRVHRALLEVNGRHDRGVRRARFIGVLRGQNCPAILVEGGYLSNPQEARRIADPAYRQRLAEALAQTLAMKPAVVSPPPLAAVQRAEILVQAPAVLSTNLLQP
jgi:N-acetylmuramoyl-L-alanine amidase